MLPFAVRGYLSEFLISNIFLTSLSAVSRLHENPSPNSKRGSTFYVNPIPGEDAGYGVINILNIARKLSAIFV